MSGFDCSGFVQWAYKSVGVSLPRTAREQSVLGARLLIPMKWKPEILWLSGTPAWVSPRVYTLGTAIIHSPGAARRDHLPQILISVRRSSAPP